MRSREREKKGRKSKSKKTIGSVRYIFSSQCVRYIEAQRRIRFQRKRKRKRETDGEEERDGFLEIPF